MERPVSTDAKFYNNLLNQTIILECTKKQQKIRSCAAESRLSLGKWSPAPSNDENSSRKPKYW